MEMAKESISDIEHVQKRVNNRKMFEKMNE